jgi:annexin A7/11
MTIDLYPPIVHANDLSPDVGFGADIDEDIEEIVAACKGWGSNKKKVIAALGRHTAEGRYKLAARYKELHGGKGLDALMKKEMSGDFGVAMELLGLPPHEAECAMLKMACKGLGASANVIYSIICGRTNREMEILKKTFYRMYTKDLGKMLAAELHGDNERLIFNCLQAGEEVFDPQFHNREKAIADAEEIHKKGQGRWGTDERGIFKILCASPPQFLDTISNVYAEKYGYTLWKAMEKELGGNVREACVFLVGMKQKPYETIAGLIKKACAGFGTDEFLLTCCVIRYQYVMNFVQPAHIELSGKTIQDRIRKETSGSYRDVLVAVANAGWPEA